MRQSDLRGNAQSAAEMTAPTGLKPVGNRT